MLGNNTPPTKSPSDIFETGTTLMQNGAYADAFLLFSKFSEDENQPAVQYNLGLCYWFAGKTQPAIEALEKAFSAMKKNEPVSASKNPPAVQETFDILSQSEAGQTDYLKPMPQKLPTLMPASAKRNILRLLIDVCRALENWDAVINYAAALPPAEKNYRNVTEATDEARRNKRII